MNRLIKIVARACQAMTIALEWGSLDERDSYLELCLNMLTPERKPLYSKARRRYVRIKAAVRLWSARV